MLALLDLSAAFDTIDHDILLSRLKTTFGIDGLVLKWIESYLSSRQQKVKIKSNISSSKVLKFGVPQGSVLGPILFSLYIQPLSEIFTHFHFDYHLYADDSQMYTSTPLDDMNSMLKDLDACVTSVNQWMQDNKPQMNRDKTEIILFQTKIYTDFRGYINNECIPIATKVRNLGAILNIPFQWIRLFHTSGKLVILN
jgi:hypothetical protein